MFIKIIKLLLRLDSKIKLTKNYSINYIYDNFISETASVFADIETEYYLKDL